MLDGERLLALFALLMLVIAALMLRTRSRIGLPDALNIVLAVVIIAVALYMLARNLFLS